MSTTDRNSNTSRNSSNGWWPFRRQLKEPEAAEDLGLPEIEPYYPNRLRNRIILGIALVVVIVGVAVGVVLLKNGSEGDKAMVVENRTATRNETTAPSSSPTMPTAPPSPKSSQRPTAAPSSSVVNQFLSGLPAYSVDLAENDPDSPQAKALAWLDSDPQYHDYRHVYRLNQRYALAVFYYSTDGESWTNKDGWLSDDNECTWYVSSWDSLDSVCGDSSRLLVLSSFGSNDLNGSIPRELELLTNLEIMYLRSYALSGTIPTEL
jgi:hypothetical protein